MGLNKATGDMYGWVTHTHTHLRGECPHKCGYCYARKGRAQRHYQGPLRLAEKELKVRYGSGRTIFVEHMSDLFAEGVREDWQRAILRHCCSAPENTYVFQTRNLPHVKDLMEFLPPLRMIGTTVETNLYYHAVSAAPYPLDRLHALGYFARRGERTFLTIEPIIAFDDTFAAQIADARPGFINIGADSKRCGLTEPTADKIFGLIAALEANGIEVRTKPNLYRLLKDCGRKDITFHFPNSSRLVIAL